MGNLISRLRRTRFFRLRRNRETTPIHEFYHSLLTSFVCFELAQQLSQRSTALEKLRTDFLRSQLQLSAPVNSYQTLISRQKLQISTLHKFGTELLRLKLLPDQLGKDLIQPLLQLLKLGNALLDQATNLLEEEEQQEQQQQDDSSSSSTSDELHKSLLRFHLLRGEELGRLDISTLIGHSSIDDASQEFFDIFDGLLRVVEIRSLPYHNQSETVRHFLQYSSRICEWFQSNGSQLSHAHSAMIREVEDSEDQECDVDEEEREGGLSDACMRLQLLPSFVPLMENGARMQFRFWKEMDSATERRRMDLLKTLHELGPGFLTPIGENGYSRVYTGGEDYSVSDIENDFLCRNPTPQADQAPGSFDYFDSFDNTITVAISYKHFPDGDEIKISQTDLKAIASFIKASHGSLVRFWVDTKLPPTDDGSFERWLVRGLRPYARYMTIICPSAAENANANRFWLANEKHIATVCRGIFHLRRDGIFFDKGIGDLDTLSRRLLMVVIGEEGVPTGVRKGEDGKAIQWALRVLGTIREHSYISSGVRIDDAFTGDDYEYSEYQAITQIDAVVRKYGPITLPLVAGRTWNRENPLLKGKIPSSEGPQLNRWIGLAHPEEKRIVYFFHQLLLCHMNENRTVTVLRVRLRASYDSVDGNSIEEKVLMEIPTAEAFKLVIVTVPLMCEWSVFSGDS